MTVRRLAEIQPESFAFSEANTAWAYKEIAKYPEGRQASAVIPLLWRAQEQEGWVTEPAIRTVAEILDMPTIRVLEVATFYTMFHLEPVGGKAHLQLCGTTPCWLRGADALKEVCRRRIHHDQHHLSGDGGFSWEEVECLGACVNAPLVQIGADTYEDLTPESLEKLLDDIDAGRPIHPGPQIDRQFSAPEGGPATLTEIGAARLAASRLDGNASADDDLDDSSGKSAPDTDTGISTTEVGVKPQLLDAPRDGKADDLKRVSGVGPKIEGILNSLGVYHFDQIAGWSADEIEWVDGQLKFKGRIDREDWINQAKILAQGGETDFSRRSDAAGKEPS